MHFHLSPARSGRFSQTVVFALLMLGLGARCTRVVDFGAEQDGASAVHEAGTPCSAPAASCLGDRLVECVAGTQQERVCPLGCVAAPARCRLFRVSNLGDVFALAPPRTELAVPAGETWALDTSTGAIRVVTTQPSWSVVRTVRPAGEGEDPTTGVVFASVAQVSTDVPALGVFAAGKLDVPLGARIVGLGDRPLVILAATSITIAGELSVGADLNPGAPNPGPGGFAGAIGPSQAGGGPGGGRGGQPGKPTWVDAGGGGGAFGSQGGRGGRGNATEATAPALPGEGGAVYGVATLVPLVGGSGGGGGSSYSEGKQPRWGGNGGGAAHLAAGERIEVRPSGVIDACGGGAPAVRHNDSGGGGGAGGAILLEAPEVIVEGIVGANGGAGAQASPGTDAAGLPGQPGRPDRAPSPGTSTRFAGGGGGAGSDPSGAADAGEPAQNGGGGGGGAGRIRINTADGLDTYDRGLLPTRASGLASVGRVNRDP